MSLLDLRRNAACSKTRRRIRRKRSSGHGRRKQNKTKGGREGRPAPTKALEVRAHGRALVMTSFAVGVSVGAVGLVALMWALRNRARLRLILRKLANFQTLYDKKYIVQNFRDNNGGRLLQLGVSHRVIHANKARIAPLKTLLLTGTEAKLPAQFQCKLMKRNAAGQVIGGPEKPVLHVQTVEMEKFLEDTWTTGLLVVSQQSPPSMCTCIRT